METYNNGILFYHDKAGQGDVHEIIGEVTKPLSKMIHHLTVYRSLEQGEIYQLLTETKQQYDIYLILGGDGTVHELINGIIDGGHDKPIAILPGGTFNDFTKTLHLNPNPVRAAEQLLDAEILTYDVLKTNERYALNFSGMGLMVENSLGVNPEVKSKLGKFSYLFSAIKNVTNPKFFDYEIQVDGEYYSGTSSMIVIANGQYVGGNRIPLSELSPSDGILNVFIFKDSGFKTFTDMIGKKSEVNWNEISQSIEHISGKEVHVETKDTIDVDVDGEIDLETPLHVEVIPGKLKILTAQVSTLFS